MGLFGWLSKKKKRKEDEDAPPEEAAAEEAASSEGSLNEKGGGVREEEALSGDAEVAADTPPSAEDNLAKSKVETVAKDSDAAEDTTTYEDVKYGELKGRLTLSRSNLLFQATDTSKRIKLGWDQLDRLMISPESSPNTFLKIVSRTNRSRLLTLPDRTSLVQVRRDIRRRSSTFASSAAPNPSKRSSAPSVGSRADDDATTASAPQPTKRSSAPAVAKTKDTTASTLTPPDISKISLAPDLGKIQEEQSSPLCEANSQLIIAPTSKRKSKSNRKSKRKSKQKSILIATMGDPDFNWRKHRRSVAQAEETVCATTDGDEKEQSIEDAEGKNKKARGDTKESIEGTKGNSGLETGCHVGTETAPLAAEEVVDTTKNDRKEKEDSQFSNKSVKLGEETNPGDDSLGSPNADATGTENAITTRTEPPPKNTDTAHGDISAEAKGEDAKRVVDTEGVIHEAKIEGTTADVDADLAAEAGIDEGTDESATTKAENQPENRKAGPDNQTEDTVSNTQPGGKQKQKPKDLLSTSLHDPFADTSSNDGSSSGLGKSLGLSAAFGASTDFLNSSVVSLNNSQVEAQILAAMGKNSLSDLTGEELEKATRKARRRLRMSTRDQAMHSSFQQSSRSRKMSLMTGVGSTRTSISMRSSTRMSISRRGSQRFTMLKDLEERDEFQKVQAGAFLRGLYKLAASKAKEQLKEELMHQDASNSSGTGGRCKDEGLLSFEGMDLSALMPEQAKSTIEALHKGAKIEGDELMRLVQAGVEVLSQEETVVDLREAHPNLSKVTAVGDLHGSLECLMVVLQYADVWNLGKGSVIVFDGDFVDRGYNSLEVIETLLLLKLSHPQSVFLLRGNHEDSMTAASYGFQEEVFDKYGYDKGDEIWWEFGPLFASFPIIARSNTAAIMHGGIPVEEFDLSDVNEVAKEIRCQMKSVTDPYDDEERLLQGILWSDPSEEEGINFSDRGAGFTFGPDITRDFLDRHGLKYVIRAHEVVETGHCRHDVGEGRGVVTIFSSANYPAGEGTNYGAVLFLDDQTGEYTTKDFIHTEENESKGNELVQALLGSFVDGHKSQLTKAFREHQNEDGHVTCSQWADIVVELLELPDLAVPWLDMQPQLAPTTEPEGDYIDWTAFLNMYTTVPTTQLLAKEELAALSENTDKLLDIFQLIDNDMDGTISKEEFSEGMKLLNQQIADESKKIFNAEELFESFDVDGNGELDIDELSKALQESTALRGATEALKDEQMEHLKLQQDMIATAFHYLDADNDGIIEQIEFEIGFDEMNKTMPDRDKFDNHQEWFDRFDLNDDAKLDFACFKKMFCAI